VREKSGKLAKIRHLPERKKCYPLEANARAKKTFLGLVQVLEEGKENVALARDRSFPDAKG